MEEIYYFINQAKLPNGSTDRIVFETLKFSDLLLGAATAIR